MATDTPLRRDSPVTLHILLVEDSPGDARLLREILRESTTHCYEVTHVERLDEALRALGSQRFDCVLSDLSLPDSLGFSTFLKMQSHSPRLPIVVLSGLDDETLAARAVQEGAQDYLVKGQIDANMLNRAVAYAIARKRSEEALQESERRYKHLLESVTDYMYTVQLEEGRPVATSHGPGCATVTGYLPEEYMADPELWYRMVHAQDRPAVLKQAAAMLSGEGAHSIEHRIIHRNGQVRWVRNTPVPQSDEHGRLLGYDGLVSDITARKEAEENLRNSEAFYHSLVETLPQNILRKDVNERFTFANRRFCAILGKSLDEIVGKTDFDFFPPQLAAKYQKDDQFVISTGQTFETIEENQAPDGEMTYVNVIKTPIYDTHGKIIGIQGIFWDITERKRAEDRLRQANEELALSEKRQRAMLADLQRSHEELKAAQNQLIQAEKLESVGRLAAGVAHEVKNPLAIILVGANYLAKTLPADKENAIMAVNEIREAVSRADTIIRGLLDFSSSRQLAMTMEDVNGVIEQALMLVRHQLSELRVELVKKFASKLPLVGMDRNQIQQVFLNLFMNAAHAMPKGGTLTVRTQARRLEETSLDEGSRDTNRFWRGDTVVIVDVEDTGSGIPEDVVDKVFDPFFTTKPTGVGTGLGLTVTKKIIELHGGTIELRNRREGGARATITLKAQRKD